MSVLKLVTADHPLYIKPPVESAEHVYSAIEFDGDEVNARSVVCYRTKDGVTHQAIFENGEHAIRVSRKPFGK